MPKTTIPEEFTIEDLTKDLQKIIDKNTVDSLITLLDIMLNHSELLSFHFIKSSMVVGINDFNNNLEKLLAVPRPDKNANELNIKIHLLIYLLAGRENRFPDLPPFRTSSCPIKAMGSRQLCLRSYIILKIAYGRF